ncbi:MAG TPA: hypothetical protein VMV94_17625, partial [Phycisphaerae bacterium]|nr:hypothetical protein [Phycisphaerae bacterium]
NAVTMQKGYPAMPDVWIPIALVGILVSTCLLVVWLCRALGSLGGSGPEPVIPPRCEGCGYDLTHQPESGRCSECGLALASSLTPGLRRPGCSWEARAGVVSLVWTALGALISPRRFYERLKLRTPQGPSRAFARWQYLIMGGCSAAWIYLMVAEEMSNRGDWTELFIPLLVGFAVPLVGWGLQRLVSAFVASWWVIHRMVPDMGWGRKVFAYETSFLWVFCLYNGAWLTSFFLYNAWLSWWLKETFDVRPHLGAFDPEEAAVFLGDIALILAWFCRYGVIGRAIRWSNF